MTAERTDIDVKDLIRRYLAGESEQSLSIALNVSRPLIRRRLLSAGIRPRGSRAANKLRMGRLSAMQRANLTAAAHAAVRGTHPDRAVMERTALTRQRRCAGASRIEFQLGHHIRSLGLTPQLAVGPYNCDFGAFPIAVEVLGGHWHTTGRRRAKYERKIRDLLSLGWSILLVVHDVQRAPITPNTAQHVIAWTNGVRSNPTMRPEYRVIRGTGEFVASGGAQDDEITLIGPYTLRRDTTTGRYERIPRHA